MKPAGALALVAIVVVGAAAAAARKPPPTPFVDVEHGFQLTLPSGWQRVEQDTGATGPAAPLYKAANDAGAQWLVVVSQKGPTDDAEGAGEAALANFEAGFAGAPGYKRLSLARREVLPGKPQPGVRASNAKPRKLPAIDLWFTMQRDGKSVVVGARGLMFRSYVLTLVVDAPGSKVPRATRGLVESFVPAPAPAD
jgi:hypothetical protein